MSLTTDPNDPRLKRGADEAPVPQNEVYLVLSEEECAKGFVRPLRRAYRHVGDGPRNPLRDLTPEEQERHRESGYVKYEAYPKGDTGVLGRFWTQAQLDRKGCGAVTTMGLELCQTYARNPKFYGSTYCTTCQMHRPVNEFAWVEDGATVGS